MSHSDSSGHHKGGHNKLFLLALGALGVVYGDIGTSPLYAIKEIFFGHAMAHYARNDVLGVISIVFWSLTLIVALKYVFLVLRADSDGEGGVFALYSLIARLNKKAYAFIITLLIIAAGLLYGDGIITPAISVISAVEGLSVVTKTFDPYIVPITIVILTGLFFIQSKGTAKVGSVFGPIMLIWFICIGLLGGKEVLNNPSILASLNPVYAVQFFLTHNIHTIFLVLGSVMLVITGGEAMYADMGHFGRQPIRISWYTITYPALILSYLGQGAFLLSGKEVIGENLFFSLVPHMFLIPMVILATLATVIASQALISGAFSLTAQAISLGLFPYIPMEHTHHEHEGQIYIPFINWILYAGAIALVLVFQSSARLASAYGLAVSGVMFVTTLGMIVIAKELWQWKPWKVYGIFIPFLIIDGVFLTANSLKIFEGGFIPLYIGLSILILIKTWVWGRSHVRKTYAEYPVMSIKELIKIKEQAKNEIPRPVIFMTPNAVLNENDTVPLLKQMFWERYEILPKHMLFVTVSITKTPHISGSRYEITKLYDSKNHGSIVGVIAKFGFMENPNVEKTLENLAKLKEIPLEEDTTNWSIHIVHERLIPGKFKSILNTARFALYNFMHKNTDTADHFFGLGNKQALTIEVMPVKVR